MALLTGIVNGWPRFSELSISLPPTRLRRYRQTTVSSRAGFLPVPVVRTLYCRPLGRVTTPSFAPLAARNAAPSCLVLLAREPRRLGPLDDHRLLELGDRRLGLFRGQERLAARQRIREPPAEHGRVDVHGLRLQLLAQVHPHRIAQPVLLGRERRRFLRAGERRPCHDHKRQLPSHRVSPFGCVPSVPSVRPPFTLAPPEPRQAQASPRSATSRSRRWPDRRRARAGTT